MRLPFALFAAALAFRISARRGDIANVFDLGVRRAEKRIYRSADWASGRSAPSGRRQEVVEPRVLQR